MKKVIALSAVICASFATSVSANGFSPWSQNANQSMVQSVPDEAQEVIDVRSFYRSNTSAIEKIGEEPQADIQIRPWYAADKI